MFFGRRGLLIGLAVCAILYLANLHSRRIRPAHSGVAVSAEGSFQPDGEYPGKGFTHAFKLRTWGSWSGSDDNIGAITIGPFSAPRTLRLGLGGYPSIAGNALRVELADGSGSIPIKHPGVGEQWEVVEIELPADWSGRPVRIVGRDAAQGIGGWFGVSEPVRGGRSDSNHALLETLAAFAINGLLLGLLYAAAVRRLTRCSPPTPRAPLTFDPAAVALPSHWVPLAAGAVVALCGYATFWAYYTNALLGRIVSWSMIAAALGIAAHDAWTRRRAGQDGTLVGPSGAEKSGGEATRDVSTVLMLMLVVGAFHLGLLHLFPTAHDFYTLAANRYQEAMPSDNMLPHTMAERLFAAEPMQNPADEWRSSDRPPLQTGWQLLTWPAGKVLGLERLTMSGTAAVWFQLLWVAAAYGLLRSFGVERRRTAGWIAVFALGGFFVLNTTYTWPKLSAGAFACGTYTLLSTAPAVGSRRVRALWTGLFAVLAWLSHGGVAFSFLALLPLVVWQGRRGAWRGWLPGVAVALLLVSPWIAYQTFGDPPGNRLFKWHLAGQSEIDPRGTWQALRENYAALGWREAAANKASNFHAQVFGDWKHLVDFSSGTAGERRRQEFFHTGRALTWWPVLAGLALVITRCRRFLRSRDFLLFTAWLALTVVVWCLLMFGRYQAVIHHGSYALMVGLFVLFSVVLERCDRRWLAVLAVLQAVTLGTTWSLGNTVIHGRPAGLFFVLATGGILAGFIVRAFRPARAALSASNPVEQNATRFRVAGEAPARLRDPNFWQRSGTALQVWWARPQLNVWVLAVFAILLFLRKPHALHTPQLWAEDGSIFLMQADLHGPSALVMPYMGYLHTLPRLIAWFTPHVFDPAFWPAFYNGLSFVIWLAVLARFFTARFDLPAKPWLAFALIAVPHPGEVFFNITNLQWLTAFVLIQQAIINRPVNLRQRITDLLLLALIALTGPFGVIFLPLFAWRWWRDRHRDNLAAFLVVLLCAAIQAWFVVKTGSKFEFQDQPLQVLPNLVVFARRLIIWPLLGADAALSLPPAATAAIGGTILAAIIGWALRPDERRPVRLQILAALALISAAALYRTRPDTWAADNLEYGDRYFYIPRVLVAWLVVLELDARRRTIANLARIACLASLIANVSHYTSRAPIDYDWASHVEPIRKGVRADIPTLPEGWTLEYRGRPRPD